MLAYSHRRLWLGHQRRFSRFIYVTVMMKVPCLPALPTFRATEMFAVYQRDALASDEAYFGLR